MDAYDSVQNIVYEFYGDFWHGNLNVYKPSDYNKLLKKTMADLNKITTDKEKLILDSGYKLISIWENDWKLAKATNQLTSQDEQ